MGGNEAGYKVADPDREHGISPATFYNWKGKYGGMSVSELSRITVTVYVTLFRTVIFFEEKQI